MSSELTQLGPLMIDVVGLTLTDQDKQRLLHPLVGGVILFARNYENPEQVTSLIAEIKSLRSPALLVAVDQEGGRVQRFKDGFTRLPAAAEFGALWDKDKQTAPMRTFEIAYTMASELRAVGIDFSFAPVLDITTEESDVIGDRCFHTNPKAAIELQGAFIDGMHSAGMVAIGKHFPGHGGVSGDSHTCLPQDNRTLEQLQACDLLSYEALVDELQGVMTAHIIYSQCDPEVATHSKFWVQDQLRDKLGFSGIVFSDDLSMAGALSGGEPDDSAILDSAHRALAAGCDMLLLCNQPEQADLLLKGLDDAGVKASESLSYRLNRLRGR